MSLGRRAGRGEHWLSRTVQKHILEHQYDMHRAQPPAHAKAAVARSTTMRWSEGSRVGGLRFLKDTAPPAIPHNFRAAVDRQGQTRLFVFFFREKVISNDWAAETSLANAVLADSISFKYDSISQSDRTREDFNGPAAA